ncbi:drug/metabolite transporter [Komagataeibacter medellinensis NBRC 3288]|uniref:Drug/metabolite transporter n=2 Tax=Komagataeibacter medellinensis TaxID=1177712 RepID=G2I285_KOMMN|nr:drug/metabolite transporter [Komagataeibacter medellinensis NBRC 3288]
MQGSSTNKNPVSFPFCPDGGGAWCHGAAMGAELARHENMRNACATAMAGGSVFCAGWCHAAHRPAVSEGITLPKRSDLPIVFSVGGLQMMAFTALGLVAMQHTNAGRAALLAYNHAAVGHAAGMAVHGAFMEQRPGHRQVMALCVGLSGIVLICSPIGMDWSRPGALQANCILLAASMCWSVVIVRHHKWTSSPLALAPWQMLLATIVLSVRAWVKEGPPSHIVWSGELAGLLLFIGPLATSVCFVISCEFRCRVSTFSMSSITLAVPVIGLFASMVFLHEVMTPVLGIGLALIIAGGVLSARTPARDGRRVLHRHGPPGCVDSRHVWPGTVGKSRA